MHPFRISLFGKFQAQFKGHTLGSLGGDKGQALFCYLLLYRDRPHSREILADLLWDDVTTARSKGYLRKTLWQIQTELNKYAELSNGNFLLIDSDWVQINQDAEYWLDVVEFEKTFAQIKDFPGWQLTPVSVQSLQTAVELYTGDLLECGYYDYCLFERTRFSHMYLSMLDKLMDYCIAHQEFETGLVYGLRILRYDQARESTHRRLMRLHYLAKNRTEALRQYTQCTAVLQKELGVEPAKQTVRLFEQIQADQLDSIETAVSSQQSESYPGTFSLSESIFQLQKLQQELLRVQHDIQHGIKAAEMLLLNS